VEVFSGTTHRLGYSRSLTPAFSIQYVLSIWTAL